MVPYFEYNGLKESFSLPRQAFESTYVQNGYVDIVRPSILINTDLLYGDKIKRWETEIVPDIDAVSDYEFAKKLLYDSKFKQVLDYLG